MIHSAVGKVLGVKSYFFTVFLLIFCPLDPDPWICIFLRIRIRIQDVKMLRIFRIGFLSTIIILLCLLYFFLGMTKSAEFSLLNLIYYLILILKIFSKVHIFWKYRYLESLGIAIVISKKKAKIKLLLNKFYNLHIQFVSSAGGWT